MAIVYPITSGHLPANQWLKLEVKPVPTPLQVARERFGGPFAFEPHTKWKPNPERVLTRWRAKESWSNQT